MKNVYVISSINEWISNKNLTKFHIKDMVNKIQKKSKNKITNGQLNKIETDKGVEYTFSWIKDHVIFEKILKQYQKNLIDKNILISYRKDSNRHTKFGGKDGLDIIDTTPADEKSFIIYVKDLYTERAKPPKYIYHVTDPKYRESIREKGILKRSSEEGNWKGDLKLSYPPLVFAINDYTHWVNKLSRREDIWVIDTEKINNKWWSDLNFHNVPSIHEHVRTYMTFDDIPPDAIRLMSGNKNESIINERKNYGNLYHFTLLFSLVLILEKDYIEGYPIGSFPYRRRVKYPKGSGGYVCFTRDKTYIERTQDLIPSGGKSGIVVDGERITDRYILQPFNAFHGDIHYRKDEAEETLIIKGGRNFKDVKKYIKYLIVPSFGNFYREIENSVQSGMSLEGLLESINKLFNTDFEEYEIFENESRRKELYDLLVSYVKKTNIPYEIY